MREKSQGRRETASLATYSENNHYTMTAAGRETTGKQRQQDRRPEPAGLSFFTFSPHRSPSSSRRALFLLPFSPFRFPFRRRRSLFPIPFSPHRSPLPSVGPAGHFPWTTGSKAQNFSRYEVKKRISPRLTGKSEWGSKNEFQKV